MGIINSLTLFKRVFNRMKTSEKLKIKGLKSIKSFNVFPKHRL